MGCRKISKYSFKYGQIVAVTMDNAINYDYHGYVILGLGLISACTLKVTE